MQSVTDRLQELTKNAAAIGVTVCYVGRLGTVAVHERCQVSFKRGTAFLHTSCSLDAAEEWFAGFDSGYRLAYRDATHKLAEAVHSFQHTTEEQVGRA